MDDSGIYIDSPTNCRGAEVDQAGENERTPLHEATETGHTTVVKWLIEKGADTLTRDNEDNTPYDLAFKQDNKEVRCAYIRQWNQHHYINFPPFHFAVNAITAGVYA